MALVDDKLCLTLGKLIETLTNSGLQTLDEDVFKKVKKICKSSQGYVEWTYQFVLKQLKKRHAEVRFGAFLICVELFEKSHVFRELLIKDMQVVFELTAGTNPKKPLPRPKAIAVKLQRLLIFSVQKWNQEFGDVYKQLQIGYNFLRHHKKVDFDALAMESAAVTEARKRQERHMEVLSRQRMLEVQAYITDNRDEIAATLATLKNCISLLLPSPENFFIAEEEPETNTVETCGVPVGMDYSSDENEDSGDVTFRQHGLNRNVNILLHLQPEAKISVQENPENTSIIENARDIVKLVNKSLLPKLRKLLTACSKYGSPNCSEMKTLIIWKEQMDEYLTKYKELNVGVVESSDDDDDDLVEVRKEGYEEDVEEFLPVVYGNQIPGKAADPVPGIQHDRHQKGNSITSQDQVQSSIECSVPSLDQCSKQNKINTFEDAVPSTSRGSTSEALPSIGNVDVTSTSRGSGDVASTSRGSGDVASTCRGSGDVASTSRGSGDVASASRGSGDVASSLRGSGDVASTSRGSGDVASTSRGSGDIASTSRGSGNVPSTSRDDRKSKLLAIAPKLPYDVDLYHWEDEHLTAPTLLSVKLDNPKFWGTTVDDMDEIPDPSGVAALRTRVIEFTGQFQPVKWSCRAPLSSGKLCPRRDRVKCPFHGKIVARDETGKCANPDDESIVSQKHGDEQAIVEEEEVVPDWQDPKLLAELKAATGIDLKMPPKKGKGKKKKEKVKPKLRTKRKGWKVSAQVLKEIEKRNFPGLTNIKKRENDVHKRLSRIVFNRSTLNRVANAIDQSEHRRHRDKFGDQFNYMYGTS